MIYVIFAIKHFLSPFHSFSLQFKNKHYNVDIVFSLFAIQFRMNYTSIVLYCLLSYNITHYFNFNFNGWVFQCVYACVCVHSLLFVMNHFDFDTHFGWPMVKRSENLKFITNHLLLYVIFFSFASYGSNQINNVYVIRVRYSINATQNTNNIRQMSIFRKRRFVC